MPTDFTLTPGVVETGFYGNKFNGAKDADGKVTGGFYAAGSEDMVLRLSGYDIDFADEVEIFVNGVSIGYLDEGVNEGTKTYVISISADLLVEGENTITFSQTGPVNWKWGITDLLIESTAPVTHLELDSTETGTFGNKFNGTFDADGVVSMTFDATGQDDLSLTFDGYDIDFADEVEVLLNGVSLGLLAAGINEGLASYDFTLSAGSLIAGENVLTFRQTTDVNWKWGVTNLRLEIIDPPELTLGVTDTASYGNKFDGALDDDGVLKFTFQNTGSDLSLTFDGYDIDFADEVEVFLNGTSLGFVRQGPDLGLVFDQILIQSEALLAGQNTLTFEQAINDTFVWGVTNLTLEAGVIDEGPVALEIGVTDTGRHGNRYEGAFDDDGDVTFVFQTAGTDDLQLSFAGYDIDFDDEVEVLLNGVSLGLLATGVNDGTASYDFMLSAGSLLAGENVLTFRQTTDVTWKWGVTDIRLDVVDSPELQIGVTDTASYGNKFNGALDDDGVVKFTFQNTGSDLSLTFDAYDIDFPDEVEVFLNGTSLGFVRQGTDMGLVFEQILIHAEDLLAGENTISFEQALNDTFMWGVTNLTLEAGVIDQAPIMLEIGVPDTGHYGNRYDGAFDSDGRQLATFESTGQDLELAFSAYDVDTSTEIQVFLNGELIETLEAGPNNDYAYYRIALPGSMQIAGTNTIEFRQADNTLFVWGVTDIRLDVAPETYTPVNVDYDSQWYLLAHGDIERIWADYTGEGVRVGIYDNGVQYTHHDLNGNYDTSLHASSGGTVLDPLLGTAEHGTAVAGIIASENDGVGTVGIAFNATISGVDIIGGPASAGSTDLTAYADAMQHLVAFDVVNHSWGSTPGFDQTPETLELFATTVALFEQAVETGRGGLGTVLVKSAGNDSANSAGDMIDSSRTTISVGALNEMGSAASYSNHGANLLVSAFSSDPYLSSLGIRTTDLTGLGGYAAGDYTGSDAFTGFGGTSAAAPMVSATVALMLEANPDLGWRDVQNILAYSSSHTGRLVGDEGTSLLNFADLFSEHDWQINGADNWNGGGLHFSEDYGYGVLDIYAAVRMAEVWHLFGDAQTSADELSHTAISSEAVTVQAGGYQTVSFTGADMLVESVEITLTLSEAAIEVYLVSAEGTRVQLLDELDYTGTLVDWTFGAQAFRGESGVGTWSLEFVGGGTGSTVTDWEVSIFGAAESADDVYHYTDEIFAEIILDDTGTAVALVDDVSRSTLSDSGGIDWLDLSAMTGNLQVSLASGVASTSDARAFLTIAEGTVIENVVGGDRNDILIGNDADNEMHGMRGSDRLAGGGGDDLLVGGEGSDTFVFSLGDGFDVIADFVGGFDLIELWDFGLSSFDALAIGTDGANNATISFGEFDQLTLAGVDAAMLSADDFEFYHTAIA